MPCRDLGCYEKLINVKYGRISIRIICSKESVVVALLIAGLLGLLL